MYIHFLSARERGTLQLLVVHGWQKETLLNLKVVVML